PAITDTAIDAANARSAALRCWDNCLSLAQLQVMISGLRATAALKAPIVLRRPPVQGLAKAVFTGYKVTSGASAKMLADSPVPCPVWSSSGCVAPGPSITGATR